MKQLQQDYFSASTTGQILGKDASRVGQGHRAYSWNGMEHRVLRVNGQISRWGQKWAFPVLPPPCMRRPTGAISFVDFNLLGHVGMSIESFSCTSTNRLSIQTHTVHSNFSNFKTQTIQIFHMHRGQHPSCFYSKSPSIGIHGNRWVAFSHPCGDIDHWLTLKYECLLC